MNFKKFLNFRNLDKRHLSYKKALLLSFFGYGYFYLFQVKKMGVDYSTLTYDRMISKMAGMLSNVYIPKYFREYIFKKYSDVYNVVLEDIKLELSEFSTFNHFFTREVKDRDIIKGDKNILCPADSQILEISEVVENKVLWIKNKKYNLGELLYGNKNIELDQDSWNNIKKNKNNKLYSVIFYLNPGDYHRFHSPSKFSIKNVNHIPGRLYPVKLNYIEKYDNVYEKNERLCIFGKSPLGIMTYVAVGATNVGSINLSFDESIQTNLNNINLNSVKKYNYKSNINLKIGQEVGKFNLGSTIVMIFEVPENFKFQKKSMELVRYGDILGN